MAALLAGVVSKLALLVILRLLVLVFPYAESYQVLLVLGILGVITGELAAWRSQDVARMLAFSSIAQLGMVFIAFSIPGEAGIIAGLAIGLHHLLVKPALFLLAQRWGGSVNALAGAGLKSPVAAGIFVLLALSAIGVPPLPGFWAKMLLLMPLAEQGVNLYLLALMVVLLGVVFEVGYLFRVVSRLYQRPGSTVDLQPHRFIDVTTAAALSGMLLLGVVMLSDVSTKLDVMAAQVADVSLYIQTVQPASLLAGASQ